MIRKPYAFRPSIEQLRELKDLSPEEKLDWLEEAQLKNSNRNLQGNTLSQLLKQLPSLKL